ncbi:hypothetical protein [Brachybacterium tyrofermentans]|uniref:hypothetical protein n=2 Tax=Brachybacterium tyrofermentans TaxID=47848 RepID=UPI003FD23407
MRTEGMNELLNAFETRKDGLEVAGEPGEWGGYSDKPATPTPEQAGEACVQEVSDGL